MSYGDQRYTVFMLLFANAKTAIKVL